MTNSKEAPVKVAPLFVGRDNSEAVVGRSWRAVQDIAAALGVKPHRIGRVALFDACDLAAAIKLDGANVAPSQTEEMDDETELKRMRARVAAAGGRR